MSVPVRLLRKALWLLVAAAALALLVRGANRPQDPYLKSPGAVRSPGGGPDRGLVDGLGRIAFRVEGERQVQGCALFADTDERRERGLMGRRDLGGHDAVIFRFPEEKAHPFWMRNTPLPLSIAWFDAGGRFVSSTDMEPCPDRADCPLYFPSGPSRDAIEVPRGGLAALGIGPGARLVVGGAGP